MQMKNWDAYVSQIDAALSWFSTARLTEVQNRIINVKDDIKFQKYSELLDYIYYATIQEIASRSSLILNEVEIASADAALVEAEMRKMQTMMGDSMKNMVSQMITTWEDMSHYKEQGDMTMSMKVNMDDDFDVEWWLSLKNYTAITHGFDQELQWELKGFIKWVADGENMDIELQTLIDFVMTEGNMYLLLENLNISDNSLWKEFETWLEPFIKKMQELGESKTYLAFENLEAEEILTFVETFSPDPLNMRIDQMMEKPLLEAYGKDGTNYLLRPTMHFCNMGKELSGVFDPFYDNTTCTIGQYEDMLKDMSDEWISITMSTWDLNSLTFSVEDETWKWELNIKWWNESLDSIYAYVREGDSTENMMTFSYVPNNSLNFNMNIDDYFMKLLMNVDISISDSGSIKNVDFDYIIDELMTINADYENNTFDMTMNIGPFEGNSFTCDINGPMKKDYIELSGDCTMSWDMIFLDAETINIDGEITIDTQLNKNNIDMLISVKADEEEFINISVENTGTRTPLSSGKILPPAKIISQEEAFEEIYEEMYGSYEVNYDPYYITDDSGNYFVCETYEYNESEDYEYCTNYVPESENTYNYDPYYTTDENTGEDLICKTYEFNETDNYDYCTEYIVDNYAYDEYYIVDDLGNEFMCETYEYDEATNYDSCTKYIPYSE